MGGERFDLFESAQDSTAGFSTVALCLLLDYSSVQGRFSGVDRYDINVERDKASPSEASKLILTVGAFQSFGKGAHTIMDGASPAHRDFQVYDTLGYKLLGLVSPIAGAVAFGVDMNDHANVEAREPTEAEMNQMVDDLRMQFLNAFGREAYERAVPEEDRKATEERKRKQEQ